MDGLEDRSVLSDVSGRSQTETTDQSSGQVGKNVSVPICQGVALAGLRKRPFCTERIVPGQKITYKLGMTMTRSAKGAGSEAIRRQTRSRRSSVYLTSG